MSDSNPRPKRSYLAPGLPASLAIALLALATGLAFYAWIVRRTYTTVYYEMREVIVAHEILAQDPTIPPPRTSPPEAPQSSTSVEDRRSPQPKSSTSDDLRKLFRGLQILKIATPEDTFEAFDKPTGKTAMIRRVAVDNEKMPNANAQPSFAFAESWTLNYVVALASRVPDAKGGQTNNPEYLGQLADLLAALMANQPGLAREFREGLDRFRDGDRSWTPSAMLARHGGQLSFWAPLAKLKQNPFRSQANQVRDEPVSNLELISGLYLLFGVTDVYDSSQPSEKQVKSEVQEELRTLSSLLQALLERVRSDDKVKMAVKEIPLWEGYEQAGMMIIFAWILLTLLAREINRRRAGRTAALLIAKLAALKTNPATPANFTIRSAQAQQVADLARTLTPRVTTARHGVRPAVELGPKLALKSEEILLASRGLHPADKAGFRAYCRDLRRAENDSRWFLRWLAMALPAIGFIGTKRGIAGALSQADIIVRAQDPGAQAVAISTVTGVLGIAFTTTLIALVMGLITSLLMMAQAQREAALIESVEVTFLPLLE